MFILAENDKQLRNSFASNKIGQLLRFLPVQSVSFGKKSHGKVVSVRLD